jgi:outer membrane protein assembly factor BamA
MQHCPTLVHRNHYDPQERGTGLRLREATRIILLGLALAVALCVAASAQSPVAQESGEAPAGLPPLTAIGGVNQYEGLTVRRIDFPDLPAASARRLLDLIPQKTGVALQRENVRQSIQVLHSTGRFADIQVEAQRSSDQVVLAIRTRSNFFVGEIFVEGAPNPPAANQVVNASKLQLGELFTREKLERALAGIRQLMEQNGYHQSQSRDEEQAHPETQQMGITFRITPGPHAKIGRVTVTGPAGFSQGQIQDIAKMHPGDYVTVQRSAARSTA